MEFEQAQHNARWRIFWGIRYLPTRRSIAREHERTWRSTDKRAQWNLTEHSRGLMTAKSIDHAHALTRASKKFSKDFFVRKVLETKKILASKTFGTKKSFEKFVDARVSACAWSMFSTVISIPFGWLCLVKIHRARLSTLRQVPSCSRAMLRRIGKSRLPSVKFHRIVGVYLRSVKFFHVLT